ncbi:hypothetical protein Tco_0319165 [Tanacetum coccineum]
MEIDVNDEMNDPELIFTYEAPGSPCPPPPESDTSSDSKPKDDTATTVGTITQFPSTRRSYMRRDIDSMDVRVHVLARQIGTPEAEEALA